MSQIGRWGIVEDGDPTARISLLRVIRVICVLSKRRDKRRRKKEKKGSMSKTHPFICSFLPHSFITHLLVTRSFKPHARSGVRKREVHSAACVRQKIKKSFFLRGKNLFRRGSSVRLNRPQRLTPRPCVVQHCRSRSMTQGCDVCFFFLFFIVHLISSKYE